MLLFYKQKSFRKSSNLLIFFFSSEIYIQLNRSSYLARHRLFNPGKKLPFSAHWNRERLIACFRCSAVGHYNLLKEYSCAPSTVQHAGRQQLTAQSWRKNAVAQDKSPALPENAVCSWMFTQSTQTFSTWLFPRTRQMASCHGRSQNFVPLLPKGKRSESTTGTGPEIPKPKTERISGSSGVLTCSFETRKKPLALSV